MSSFFRCGGYNSAKRRKLKFCGNDLPYDILSSDGCVRIEFDNDNNWKNRFSIQLSREQDNRIQPSKCERYGTHELV